eukprot:TRINITY_DN11005_c0_g1_i4.p1 TRINITY_DN11005_c0_g1~~TRINITY_DN11005_c0_g1_i4.p1  ORF type:complete len:869 (+),score=172.25 TRINITY_DN11005_c0_g1_i4:243-2609(+)
MAPEIFKGQPYDERCDVFSAGCVLHELCTLKRTFQATNICAIMTRVLNSHVDPIDPSYQQDTHKLVADMLAVAPEDRPSAAALLKRPCLSANKRRWKRQIVNLESRSLSSSHSQSTLTSSASAGLFVSKDTMLHLWGGGKHPALAPAIDHDHPPQSLAVGGAHFAVCTADRRAYSWNSGASLTGQDGFSSGQLGLGPPRSVRKPTLLPSLTRDEPTDVVCGEDFTILRFADGSVAGCGSSYDGCLGCGEDNQDLDLEQYGDRLDSDNAMFPIPIPLFAHKPVLSVSCGRNHVAAMTEDGLYTWGSGELGQLGHGDEDDRFTPTAFTFSPPVNLISVTCGPDATAVVTQNGVLMACGNNVRNKLALNTVGTFLSGVRRASMAVATAEPGIEEGEVRVSTIFRPVQAKHLHRSIVQVSIGDDHIAAVDAAGHVITCGGNDHGQLGIGSKTNSPQPVRLNHLRDVKIASVHCGDTFTLARSAAGKLYGWGNCKACRLPFDKDCVTLPTIMGQYDNVVSCCVRGAVTMILAEHITDRISLDHTPLSREGTSSGIDNNVFASSSDHAITSNGCGLHHSQTVSSHRGSLAREAPVSETMGSDWNVEEAVPAWLQAELAQGIPMEADQESSANPSIAPSRDAVLRTGGDGIADATDASTASTPDNATPVDSDDENEDELPAWLKAELAAPPIPMPSSPTQSAVAAQSPSSSNRHRKSALEGAVVSRSRGSRVDDGLSASALVAPHNSASQAPDRATLLLMSHVELVDLCQRQDEQLRRLKATLKALAEGIEVAHA